MLSVSITILTVLLVIISILLVLIVLMQRPKQEGLGAAFGGGMMNEALGAHTTDILQKGTVWLSVFFFTASILLAVLKTREIEGMQKVDVLKGVKQEELPPTPQGSMFEFPSPTDGSAGAPKGDPKGTPAGKGEAPKSDDGAGDTKGSGDAKGSGKAPKAETPAESKSNAGEAAKPGEPKENSGDAGGGGSPKGEATPE